MTDASTNPLLDELIRRSNRHGLVFVHVRPDAQEQLTEGHAQARLRVVRTIDELLSGDTARLACWVSFGTDLSTDDAISFLGKARDAVHTWLDNGGRICLICKHPRIAFPECRGSSLLSDAYLLKVGTETPSLTVWDAEGDSTARRNALRDLGPEALAFLDTLINELGAWENLDESLGSPLEWEALEGAGVVRRLPGGRVEPLVRSGHIHSPLQEAIAEVFEPQADFARVVRQLFSMERLVRHAVRVQAVRAFGKGWRGSLLSVDLQRLILERARPDVGPRPTIKSVRDPLEWVTLGELLDLASSDKLEGLGLPSRTWRRMADEVLPVRNRIGHMRLIRRHDAERTSSWLVASKRVHAEVLRG